MNFVITYLFIIIFIINKVYSQVSNCAIQNANGSACIECDQGYFPNANQCEEMEGCSFSDGRKKICTQCSNGYYLSDIKICIQIPNCEKTDLFSPACLQCSAGYFYEDKTKSCIKVKNCQEHYEGTQICKQCESGYYLNLKRECDNSIQKDISCMLLDQTNGKCKFCAPEYILDPSSGQCIKQNDVFINSFEDIKFCPKGACQYQPNCIAEDTNIKACVICKHDYLIQNNACVSNTALANCSISYIDVISKKQFCIKCLSGYFINQSGACQQNVQNCKETRIILNTPTCITCNKGYNINLQNQCTTATGNKCVKVTQSKCTQCIQPYVVDESDPIDCQKKLNCLKVVNNQDCEQCFDDGYFLNPNKSCEKIQNCLLNDINNKCKVCSVEGFYRDGTGVCQKIPYCLNSDGISSNSCKKCFPFFVIIDDKCVYDPNCLITDGINCIQCKFPTTTVFSTKQKTCGKKQENCLYYKLSENQSQTDDICKYCSQDYNNNMGTCIKNCRDDQITKPDFTCVDKGKQCADLNCQKCDSDINQCTQCNPNFVLQNLICQVKCNVGFYNENDICKPCAKDCIECTDSNSCQKCKSGMFRVRSKTKI